MFGCLPCPVLAWLVPWNGAVNIAGCRNPFLCLSCFHGESRVHLHPTVVCQLFVVICFRCILHFFIDKLEADLLLWTHFFMYSEIISPKRKVFLKCCVGARSRISLGHPGNSVIQSVLQRSEEWKVLSECFPHQKIKNKKKLACHSSVTWPENPKFIWLCWSWLRRASSANPGELMN